MKCERCYFHVLCNSDLLSFYQGRDCDLLNFYPTPCPICEGKGLVLMKDKWVPCLCSMIHKVKSFLYKFSAYGISFTQISSVISFLSALDPKHNISLTVNNPDYSFIFSSFSYLLLRRGFSTSYEILNLADLIEIKVDSGEIAERYSSLSSLNMDVLILTLGFSEFPNKRYCDVVQAVVENRDFHKKQTWLCFKAPIPASLSPIQSFLKSRLLPGIRWQFLEFTSQQTSPTKLGSSVKDIILHNIKKGSGKVDEI